jgi:hypothetical protein
MQHAIAELGQVAISRTQCSRNAARAVAGNGCEAASSAHICGSVSAIGHG